MSSDVKQITEVWKRLFGFDVEAVRARRGFPSLAQHLETLKKYQANSAHIDEMLKQMFPRNHRWLAPEFNDDQTDFGTPS